MNIIDRSINKNNIIVYAIAGFLTGYLSMTVEANKLRNKMPNEDEYWRINFGKQYLLNPFMYTVIATIVFFIVTNYVPQQLRKYWFVGFIMGMIIPSIKMIDNYAIDVYDVSVAFLYSWDAMVYTLFYIFIIGPLVENMC